MINRKRNGRKVKSIKRKLHIGKDMHDSNYDKMRWCNDKST